LLWEFVVVGFRSGRFGVGEAGSFGLGCLDCSDNVSVSSIVGSSAKELVAVVKLGSSARELGLVVDVAVGELVESVEIVLSLSFD